jgi:hypothetical protein
LETDLFAAFDASTLPRLTGIQFYESEFLGHCLGFQIVYDGYTDNQFLFLDVDSNICETTDMVATTDQYIVDILVGQYAEYDYSLSIIFVTNDGHEEKCGPVKESYTSLIPQSDA